MTHRMKKREVQKFTSGSKLSSFFNQYHNSQFFAVAQETQKIRPPILSHRTDHAAFLHYYYIVADIRMRVSH